MEFRRILVRATNWVGDAVMSVPALLALRHRFPDAHIAILARPWVADLYGKSIANEILPYSPAPGFKDLRAKWRMAAELRAMRFDCAILFQNAFEAAALVVLARIPVRIGYNRDSRGLLLTDPIQPPRQGEIPAHQRFYYLELLRRAGLVDAMTDATAIRLPGAQQLRAAGHQQFSQLELRSEWIGVSPGAAYGSAKRWLPERFAAAAIQVASSLGCRVALFGSATERALCDSIAATIQAAGVETHNFAGETSLQQFVELAASCRAFLTNDSGAMHVASSLGVPTVAIFGATDPMATGPTGSNSRVVREPVACSPCLLRECPIDHRCMKGVEAVRVAEAALELVRFGGE